MKKTELMKKFEAETGNLSMAILMMRKGVSYCWPSVEYNAWLESQLTWRPASELPEKDQIVIATYLNQFGKRRRVRAVYIRQYEKEEAGEDDESCVEYCEEQDEWYLKEGWYELIDNWDNYSSVAIVEGTVDYWLPIPSAPKKKLFMEDYHGELHQINPCPVCGKAPERNNCGPELQGVSCFDCDVHSTFCKEIGSNDMLLKAIEKWNDGKFDVPTNS